MTPLRQQLGDIDWKQAGVVVGVLTAISALTRWLIMPRIEKTLRKILKPELDSLLDAIRKVTECAGDMEDISETMHAIDEEVGELFKAVRANRELMLDLNLVLPRAAGVDRREQERRHRADLPAIPERRSRQRRRDDEP